MGFLSSVAQSAIEAGQQEQQECLGPSMQTVRDQTADESEAKRIDRLAEFFNTPLSALHLTTEEFDAHFPSLKELGARSIPGADREFWSTRGAYKKWREVTRRRLRAANGELAAKAALRERDDGWSALLSDIEPLAEPDGLIHPATFGALQAFADRARSADLDVPDLGPERLPDVLDALHASARRKSIRALKALGRWRHVRAIAAHLPADFDPDSADPGSRTPVPDSVREMISELVDRARYADGTYDDISETTTEAFNQRTADTYSAALVALARAAADAGLVDLRTLNCLDRLFACEVRRGVVKHWSDLVATKAGFSARSAAQYARAIAQIGAANGFDTSPWRNSLKANPMLQEGRENAKKMSKGNRAFCESLIRDPRNVRSFLRLHVLFQERARELLATDKPLTLATLRDVRMLGTCAAFAALELRGAGIRKGSALAAQWQGPNQNLLRRSAGDARWFELRISKKDMKGAYVELPPIPIRDDKYCGYEVVDWFLKDIRPLFDHANPEWCKDNKVAMSPWLFPSEKSAAPLAGGLLYQWMRNASEMVGLPMSPHNFRHGTATLLLARSWGNRERAAAYLGCSLTVLDQFYAWIDHQRKLEEVQDLLAEALAC